MKTGGIYLFNIFDYFDNENNVVLSAMGNKRMILGAYMIDMFERIGFTLRGNIIWNKGESNALLSSTIKLLGTHNNFIKGNA